MKKKTKDSAAQLQHEHKFDLVMQELADELSGNTGIVVQVCGKSNAQDCWAYAVISPVYYPSFLAAQQLGGYDLADYAKEILASGKGKSPPAGELEKIKKQRPDLSFDFEKSLKSFIGS